LTTRGRVVVVAILVAPLLLMLSLLFRSQVDASSEPTAPRPYPRIVVQPGDTLWTIAGRAAPDRDPRAVIHQIRDQRPVRCFDPGGPATRRAAWIAVGGPLVR
jgi:hypothetical protein